MTSEMSRGKGCGDKRLTGVVALSVGHRSAMGLDIVNSVHLTPSFQWSLVKAYMKAKLTSRVEELGSGVTFTLEHHPPGTWWSTSDPIKRPSPARALAPSHSIV